MSRLYKDDPITGYIYLVVEPALTDAEAAVLVLEVAGVELPLKYAEHDAGSSGSFTNWTSAWLDDNASDLDDDNYLTTLPLGGTVTVCLRTETQTCPGGTTTGNNAPTVAKAIPDQTATAGTAFSHTFPDNTFNDSDTGDTLTYRFGLRMPQSVRRMLEFWNVAGLPAPRSGRGRGAGIANW